MKSIKTRFIFFTLGLIVISVGVPVYFLITQFRANFNQRSAIMLDITVDLLDYALVNAMMRGEQKNIQSVVTNLALRKGIDHIRIINPEGIIKFASSKDDIGSNINTIYSNLNPDSLASGKVRLLNNNDYHVFSPIYNEPRCQGCHTQKGAIAYLDIDANLTSAETKFYTGSRHMIFLGALILLILVFGFYLIFQTFINKPLQKLVGAMRNVKNGDLSTHLKVERNDEFGMVNKNFNLMVDQLYESKEEINKLHFEQLQHADRLITLGELTSETAHEINNHSAIIMSRADYLALESKLAPNISEFADDINVIINQTEKISEITRNVLKHSKKTEKKFEQIDLVEVIRNTLMTLNPILKKRQVKLIQAIIPDKAIITGDSLQLEQALTNLIINSMDAIEKDGLLHVSLIDENKSFIISLSDNGCGIYDNIKEQVFSPFFTTKQGGKGSGLGLYIVKNICKNHNAEIIMESKIGTGTTFKIIFRKKTEENEKDINN